MDQKDLILYIIKNNIYIIFYGVLTFYLFKHYFWYEI